MPRDFSFSDSRFKFIQSGELTASQIKELYIVKMASHGIVGTISCIGFCNGYSIQFRKPNQMKWVDHSFLKDFIQHRVDNHLLALLFYGQREGSSLLDSGQPIDLSTDRRSNLCKEVRADAEGLYIPHESWSFSSSFLTLFSSIHISFEYFHYVSRHTQTYCKHPRVKMSNMQVFMAL